ncbi:hypothetical protein GGD56_000412 [Rhizobium mongolense]|uniref:Uncharacterized protein n=1 Tax=Rhizobium mongolense TaxID=57676 RepID=A0ABR6IFF3_9HYPH|nr:hypothetical protein [Rhizobium mongolense]
MISLIIYRKPPPILNGRIDCTTIGQVCGIEGELTAELKKQLRPGLDATIRCLGAPPAAEGVRPTKSTTRASKATATKAPATASSTRKPKRAAADGTFAQPASAPRGPAPKPISPFPEPLFEATEDPASFGAIKGLLPHAPHNLRDILATHILKQTGSYEQASYAIQDTPDVVQQHYARLLPQEKAALAAKILNQVWEAA